jgi:hypothetical protein
VSDRGNSTPGSNKRGWVPPIPGGYWIDTDGKPPKLRPSHLFTLIFVVAALLAAQGPYAEKVAPFGDDFPSWWKVLFVGVTSVLAMLNAVAVTIVLYGMAWRRKGIRFFQHPGHWLVKVGNSPVLDKILAYISIISHKPFLQRLHFHLFLPQGLDRFHRRRRRFQRCHAGHARLHDFCTCDIAAATALAARDRDLIARRWSARTRPG